MTSFLSWLTCFCASRLFAFPVVDICRCDIGRKLLMTTVHCTDIYKCCRDILLDSKNKQTNYITFKYTAIVN